MIIDIIVIICLFIYSIYSINTGSLFKKYSFLYFVDLVFNIFMLIILPFILIDVIFYGGSFVEEPKNSNPEKKEPEKKNPVKK